MKDVFSKPRLMTVFDAAREQVVKAKYFGCNPSGTDDDDWDYEYDDFDDWYDKTHGDNPKLIETEKHGNEDVIELDKYRLTVSDEEVEIGDIGVVYSVGFGKDKVGQGYTIFYHDGSTSARLKAICDKSYKVVKCEYKTSGL